MTVKVFKGKTNKVVIEIDHAKCDGDAKCVESCPSEVFVIKNKKSFAEKVDECAECCVCVDECPQKAIKHSSCK